MYKFSDQQARLPQGYKLQERRLDPSKPPFWNVGDESGVIIFGASSPKEAVNKFLAGSPTQAMRNIEELFPNQEG